MGEKTNRVSPATPFNSCTLIISMYLLCRLATNVCQKKMQTEWYTDIEILLFNTELSQLHKIKSFSNDDGDGNGNENVNQFNWPFKQRVGCPFTGDVFAAITVGVAAPLPSPCSAFSKPSRPIHFTSGTMDHRLADQFSFWFSEIVVLCKFYLDLTWKKFPLQLCSSKINLWLDFGIPLILNGPLGKQVVATVPSLTVVGRTLSFHM